MRSRSVPTLVVALVLVALSFVVLALAFAVAAMATTLVESSDWRQPWTTYAFPITGTDTPKFMTRYLQLPSSTSAGNVVLVNGREEFSNPSWNSGGAWTINGVVSEHWTTPIMGGCGIKRGATPGFPDTGAWVNHAVAENFTGEQHHWVWDTSEAYRADATDAGTTLAIVCYFSRSLGFRDPDADYVQAHPTYGRIEAIVFDP